METKRASRPTEPTCVVTADFGTSGVKVGVIGRDLAPIAVTVEPYPLSRPEPLHAEQTPADWWTAFGRAMVTLRGRVPDLAERVGGVVFCAQMCGLVAADRDGEPLMPAMIWLDKRAAAVARRFGCGFPRLFGYNIPKMILWLRIANGGPSKNGMDPPAKMMWLRENASDVWAATHRFLDVRDWLLHRATGRFVTTADTANLTWLMDSRRGREGWSEKLCGIVGIPMDRLPEIVEGSAVVGGLTVRAAADLGLPAGLPVVAGCGDVAATALGSGAVETGELHVCAGTSSWVGGFFDDRRVSPVHSYATIAGPVGFRPLLIATQETCGASFDWLAEVFSGSGGSIEGEIGDFLAGAAERRPDDPLFLPWLAGERCPIDDERLAGTFLGLRFGHSRGALIRSVIDGTVLNLRWALEVVGRERGVKRDRPLPLVGGVGDNPVFAQALADATGRTVVAATPRFAGLVGVAALAAPAMGWASDPATAIRGAARADAIEYRPQAEGRRLFDLRRAEFEAARRRLVPWFAARAKGIERFGGGGR